jgi:hypothetical protein
MVLGAVSRPYSWLSDDERKRAFGHMQGAMRRRYGGIGIWLSLRVARMYQRVNDPIVTNFRVCELGREDEESAYAIARALGTEEAYDDTVTHTESGRTFMFGCNYGS